MTPRHPVKPSHQAGQWAPDRSVRVIFDVGDEVRMMDYRYPFQIVDVEGASVDNFAEFAATRSECHWSPDSQYVALLIVAGDDGLLVYDRSAKKFTIVRLSTRQCQVQFVNEGTISIAFDEAELKQMNLQSDTPECPTERYVAPPPTTFALASLRWYSMEQQRALDVVLAAAPAVEMTAVQDGYFPYSGPLPKSTDSRVHGRHLEIHHLLGFAAVGDAQAKVWLAQIAKRDPNASKWTRVSQIIGKQTRANT